MNLHDLVTVGLAATGLALIYVGGLSIVRRIPWGATETAVGLCMIACAVIGSN